MNADDYKKYCKGMQDAEWFIEQTNKVYIQTLENSANVYQDLDKRKEGYTFVIKQYLRKFKEL